MPPKENPERACEECIHFFACSKQCGVPMAQGSATGCECYETIKSSMAYYVGTLDGAKGKIPNRLRELAEADKDGRVVILPCKVGDTVWFKTYKNNARDCIGVQPHEVTRISASIIVPGEIVDIGIPVDQIGVRVFLSETEAVAADAKPPAGNSILEV